MESELLDDEVILLDVGDVKIYDNDVEMAIDDACHKFHIEDLKAERQRPWKSVLQFVGNRVFADRKLLKSKVLSVYDNNIIPTNCNRYNYELIESICNYYIYLSNIYDKFVSTEGFSYFVNIPKDTIDGWKQTEPSSTSYRIWKKLQDIRLESIKDDALDNGNVTGTMFVGNTEYGLNLPGVSREQANKPALTADELPKFSDDSRQNDTDFNGNIANKLCEKNTQFKTQ